MRQQPTAYPTRIAQVDLFLRSLGLCLIKNTSGGSYFYFLSMVTGSHVGKSVMTDALKNHTLADWFGMGQWAWAEQFEDIYGIGAHDAVSILRCLNNDVTRLNSLCKGAESMGVTPQVLWETIKPIFRP